MRHLVWIVLLFLIGFYVVPVLAVAALLILGGIYVGCRVVGAVAKEVTTPHPPARVSNPPAHYPTYERPTRPVGVLTATAQVQGEEPMAVPPGWYQDPYGRPGLRWWDGREWTQNIH